jgi:hypothetical protein
MVRPKSLRVLIAPALLIAIVVMVSCGGSGEEKTTLMKYFNASKMRDNVTLANIATVAFDPTKDGQVQSFSIVSETPDQVAPLTLKKYAAALKDIQASEAEFAKKKKEFQDANGDAIDRILKAEGANKPLKGKDADLQKEWTKWRDETAVEAKKVTEAKKLANEGRNVVEISVQDPRNPVNVTDYEGDVATKELTIDAKVKSPEGTSSQKQFVFTLQRVILKGVVGKDGKPGDLNGRWVVTKYVAK